MARTRQRPRRTTGGPPPRHKVPQFFNICVIDYTTTTEQGKTVVKDRYQSNKYKCWWCEESIIKHSNGLIIKLQPGWKQRYYHIQCYIETNNFKKYHIPTQTKQIEGYSQLKLYQKYIIINNLLPNYISKPLRYQLQFNPNNDINNLSDQELKIYLQQRDLQCYDTRKTYEKPIFNRQKSLKALVQFLNSKECVTKHKYLVYGFCNEIDKEMLLCIPIVIHEIVFKYFLFFYEIDTNSNDDNGLN